MLFIAATAAGNANAEQEKVNLYKNSKFALGIGTAIVRFDTNLKYTDKASGNSTYLDTEGNLDLPEVSTVTTLYGGYQFNLKHRLDFSYFYLNRESEVFNFDKTLEDVRIVGNATMSDKTDFYRLDYGYGLFNDNHTKIDLKAGLYGLDLRYLFKAEGEITVDGVTTSGTIEEKSAVFAPLPLIGLDFLFHITDKWSFSNRVALVSGSHDDLTATVFLTAINAQYRINQYLGFVMGLEYFDADIVIEENLEKTDISYGYDGAYIGMHFFL